MGFIEVLWKFPVDFEGISLTSGFFNSWPIPTSTHMNITRREEIKEYWVFAEFLLESQGLVSIPCIPLLLVPWDWEKPLRGDTATAMALLLAAFLLNDHISCAVCD